MIHARIFENIQCIFFSVNTDSQFKTLFMEDSDLHHPMDVDGPATQEVMVLQAVTVAHFSSNMSAPSRWLQRNAVIPLPFIRSRYAKTSFG